MKGIEVEGYAVTIERAEGAFIVSVPELPGCTVQVQREEDAGREIRKMIGLYLLEMAAKRIRNMVKKREGGADSAKKMKR